MTKNFAAEFFGLPEYVVGRAHSVPMPLGVRVYHWAKHGEVFIPQFTCVLAASDLVKIAQEVQETAMKALTDNTVRMFRQ